MRVLRKARKKEGKTGDRSIYQVEVLPANTDLYQRIWLVTEQGNEGCVLAYRAFVALIAQRGCIGGLSSKGLGAVTMQYEFSDGTTATLRDITNYKDYVSTHKQEIREAMAAIPEWFTCKVQKKEKAGK